MKKYQSSGLNAVEKYVTALKNLNYKCTLYLEKKYQVQQYVIL
jgi:hypothetical protein